MAVPSFFLQKFLQKFLQNFPTLCPSLASFPRYLILCYKLIILSQTVKSKMTQPTIIPLDRKHSAARSGRDWELFSRDPDGNAVLLERWTGNRRSLFHKMEQYGIVPSREAEQALLAIPEQPSFREDEPKHRKAS